MAQILPPGNPLRMRKAANLFLPAMLREKGRGFFPVVLEMELFNEMFRQQNNAAGSKSKKRFPRGPERLFPDRLDDLIRKCLHPFDGGVAALFFNIFQVDAGDLVMFADFMNGIIDDGLQVGVEDEENARLGIEGLETGEQFGHGRAEFVKILFCPVVPFPSLFTACESLSHFLREAVHSFTCSGVNFSASFYHLHAKSW